MGDEGEPDSEEYHVTDEDLAEVDRVSSRIHLLPAYPTKAGLQQYLSVRICIEGACMLLLDV